MADMVSYLGGQLKKVEEYLIPRVQETLTDLAVFPTDVRRDAGAIGELVTQINHLGEAKVVGDYADDLPTVGVGSQQTMQRYQTLGTSFQYSISEIEQAQRTGASLTTDLALASANAHVRAWIRSAFFGIPNYEVNGLLNNGAVASDPGALTLDFSTEDDAKAALREIGAFVLSHNAAQNGLDSNTLLVGSELWAGIVSADVGNTSGAQYLLDRYGVTVKRAGQLDSAVRADALPNDQYSGELMALYRNSEDVLTVRVPLGYDQREPQAKDLHYIVPCRSVTGGLIIRQPDTVAIKSNITVTA